MDLLIGLLAPLLLFLAVSWLMLRDMRRAPGGFFRPVLIGFFPILCLSVANFAALEFLPSDEMAKYQSDQVAQLQTMMQASNSEAAKSVSEDDLKNLVSLFLRLLPAIICIFWLGLLTGVALLLRRWLTKRGVPIGSSPLSRWQAPDFMIWMLLLPTAILIFESRSWLGEVKPWIVDLGWNVVAVMCAIYFFQGAMVLLERISRLGPSKTLTALIILSGLCLAFLPRGQGILLGFLALGILDVWFNFRNIKPKQDDHERSSL